MQKISQISLRVSLSIGIIIGVGLFTRGMVQAAEVCSGSQICADNGNTVQQCMDCGGCFEGWRGNAFGCVSECQYYNKPQCGTGFVGRVWCDASQCGGTTEEPPPDPPPAGCGQPCVDVSQCSIAGAGNPACSSGICWDGAACSGGGGSDGANFNCSVNFEGLSGTQEIGEPDTFKLVKKFTASGGSHNLGDTGMMVQHDTGILQLGAGGSKIDRQTDIIPVNYGDWELLNFDYSSTVNGNGSTVKKYVYDYKFTPTFVSGDYDFYSSGSQRCGSCVNGNPGFEICYARNHVTNIFPNGVIQGRFFDASAVDDCAQAAAQPPIPNVDLTLFRTDGINTYNATTDVDGNYSFTGLSRLANREYTLRFVPPGEYIRVPKLLCDGALENMSLGGGDLTRRVGLWRYYGGWFQAQGGDVGAREGLAVTIPSSCATDVDAREQCGSFLSQGQWYTPLIRESDVPGGNATPGVVYAGGTGVDYGNLDNTVSSKNDWQADSGYPGRDYDYSYFFAKSSTLNKVEWADQSQKPTGSSDGLYTVSGDAAVDFSLAPGESITLLVDGNVFIINDVTVPVGSFFSVIASGTISFEANVATAHGVYIASQLRVESTGSEFTELQFRGEGTFVGWNGVTLDRNRGSLNNNEPAELFVFRPDFVVNASQTVRVPTVLWQEVAP